MVRRKTRDEAIADFVEVHGETYTYERFEYVNAVTKSFVTCRIHGDFLTTSDQHCSGNGCRLCSFKRSSKKRLKSSEERLQELTSLYNGKYVYKNLECLKNNKDYVVAVCPEHGEFSVRMCNHQRGHGCQECSRIERAFKKRSTLDIWLDSCKTVHDNFYTYEHCGKYEKQYNFMKVTCPVHGVFEIKAAYHKAGRGCTTCAQHGYDRLSPSHLYVLQDKDITKIGVTNKLPTQGRLRDINRKSGKDFSVYHTFYHEHGGKVLEIEQYALKHFRTLYEQPQNYYHGSTECFINLDPEVARQYVEHLFLKLNEQHSSQNLLGTA